jgi:hypothetical protein
MSAVAALMYAAYATHEYMAIISHGNASRDPDYGGGLVCVCVMLSGTCDLQD